MGQDNDLTWGNIVGTMVTTSDEDLMAYQKWNVIHLVTDFGKNDSWWQWHVKATN